MLTKSDYLKYLQCEKFLWLHKKRKDLTLLEEVGGAWAAETGAEVETQAYRLFPGGQLVEAESFGQLKTETIRLMDAYSPILFQPVVSSLRLFCRSDILRYDSEARAWDIIEVKSATSVKEQYLDDLAFQKICIEEAGYRVGKCILVHINNNYVRQGEIDPEALLCQVDLSADVELILTETRAEIERALKVLRFSGEPQVRILGQCTYPYDCPFIPYCFQDFPEHSIYSIVGKLGEEKLGQLIDEGVLLIRDIPQEMLTGSLLRHHQAVKHDFVHIETEKIKEELGKLCYPLYFLDYETYSPAIPFFDGYRPYQRIVFQYSLHIQEKAGAPLRHEYFLMTEFGDPTAELAASLSGLIGPEGTVIAWNMGFEKGCNSEMAERVPDFRDFFASVNERMYDLIDIFRKGYYVHKDFQASASLKKVLPVLAPDLDYSALAIGEGLTASNKWAEMVFKAGPAEEKEKIYKDLLAYCEQDTLAMVRILDFLRKSSFN